eukprot:357949-Chlamydomonas_euryale.AAC.5
MSVGRGAHRGGCRVKCHARGGSTCGWRRLTKGAASRCRRRAASRTAQPRPRRVLARASSGAARGMSRRCGRACLAHRQHAGAACRASAA